MLADKAASYLSTELGVPIRIAEIEIAYFDELTASEVYIEDEQGDTLIFVGRLHTDFDIFNFTQEEILLDNVEIDNAHVAIGVPKGKSDINLRFLTSYFSSSKPSTGKAPQIIRLDKVTLTNSYFHYFNKNYAPPNSRSFDENNMVYSSLNGHLHDFKIIGDSLHFSLDDISGKERSGLAILNLSTVATISSTIMEFDELELITPTSTLGKYLRFDYTSYADFSDFIQKVPITASLEHTSIHTDDLALFSNTLSKYKELINATGDVSGTVEQLHSDAIDIQLGKHTRYSGRATLTGLPDIATTIFDLNAKRFSTNAKDLSRLIELRPAPKELLAAGRIAFEGTFKGTISDFKTKGKLTSDLGILDTDIAYKQTTTKSPSYTGSVRSSDFALGTLLADKKLGKTSFSLSLQGSGITQSTLKSSINGDIYSITYADYDYQNIAVAGTFSENLFSGKGAIQDPNFNFDFDGTVDLTKEVPIIQIETNVAGINLKTLGIDSLDNMATFTGFINLQGSNLDNTMGTIDLDSFSLNRDGRIYTLKDVALSAKKEEENRIYALHTDLVTADISGDFIPSELLSILDYVQHIIYPEAWPLPEDTIQTKNITISLVADTYKPLLKEYLGDIFYDSVRFRSSYDHTSGKIYADASASGIKYEAVTLPQVDVNLRNGGNFMPINFSVNTAGFLQNDSTIFDVLNANGFIKEGNVFFETVARQNKTLDILVGGFLSYRNDSALVYISEGIVDIYDQSWALRKSNTPNIIYQNGITELREIDFRNGEQILYLEASSGFLANKININLNEFELDNLSPFLAGFDVRLQGTTNGYVDVSDREGFPIIEANLNIANLQLDEDTLGNLSLVSENKNTLAVAINGSIQDGLLNDMNIKGNIDFKNKDSPLDLQLLTKRSSIKPFERYLDGLASRIDGYTTTQIDIKGSLSNPKLSGTMKLDSLAFTVDYLQTRYTGDASIAIDYNSFTLKDAQLRDKNNNVGRAYGDVSHKNFQDFKFNLTVADLTNFEIMNTKRKDNELFYGTAYVDGSMKILGPLDDILLQINAKSRKGTEISIPLDNFETSGKLSYVSFVNLKDDNNDFNKSVKSSAGVRMDFNFEVTNDAKVTLIFDELIGDKIEATSHGNLRMEINTFGDFNMYGGLTIDKGSYLFTALDLINKYFIVKQGGTLSWDGNPYNARIDLEAIKREYPVTKTLMSGTAANDAIYNQPIATDCVLKLTGLLFDPEVSFDLQFPTRNNVSSNANSELNTVLERIKLDEEELNRQVFALLVLGTFVPPSFATGSSYDALDGATNTGINSLSDFASSQLNNWLGQLDTRVQLGVDYQNSAETDQAELILSLRRKFLNDRLELNYSVDAAAQGSRPYDISLQYDITEEGNIQVTGFQKQASDPTLGNLNNITTSGVGLSFRYQFDKYRLRKKKVKPE